jgi:hypothetical protein
MQYELITTQIIEINDVIIISKEEFEEQLKLNSREVYIVQEKKIIHTYGTNVRNNIIEGGKYILGGTFSNDVAGCIFSFDLKKFYKVI